MPQLVHLIFYMAITSCAMKPQHSSLGTPGVQHLRLSVSHYRTGSFVGQKHLCIHPAAETMYNLTVAAAILLTFITNISSNWRALGEKRQP